MRSASSGHRVLEYPTGRPDVSSAQSLATVFVVDDRIVPRMAAKAMLDQAQEFRHVGEASDASQALDLIAQVKPDLVLLDVDMPGMGGAELAPLLLAKTPGLKLLAWTVSEHGDDLLRMFRAGCSGYVLKDSGPEEMRRALLAALRDETPVPRKMLPEVLRRIGPLVTHPTDLRLTPREADVLRHLARGAARKQMAASLGISVASVDTHVKSLYRKLEVSSQTEAVNVGLRMGFIRVDEL